MTVKKQDQSVKDLATTFGSSNFADILNRLWLLGFPVGDLQGALATTSNGTNDNTDIITRLLNSGKVTPDQFRTAMNQQIPNIPPDQYPFHPESKNPQGVVVPTNQNTYANAPGMSTYVPGPPGNADVGPGTITPIPPGMTPPPAGSGGSKTTTTVTAPTPPAPTKRPVTDQEISDYEKDHYGPMLWIKSVPDIADKIKLAAQNQWTPEKFKAEVEATPWWQSTQDSVRKWTMAQADTETFKASVGSNATLAKTYASQLGVTLTDEEANQLGSDYIKWGWGDQGATGLNLFHQAIIGFSKPTDTAGGLGKTETDVKTLGKQFLVNMSDDDAYGWAKQIAGGTATTDNVTQALRAQSKAAYPTIAEYIDNGGIPQAYFSNHINNAAKLLEVDPSSIDLTDSKFHDIISYADPTNGKVRPMTLSETDKFIKSKDEYWKTDNASNEVSSMVGTLGQVFGKVGI